MPRRRFAVLLLASVLGGVGAVGALPGVALGQSGARAGEQPKERARSLANRAFELYQRGRYEEANDLFRQADEAYHAPTLVLMIARSYAKLGKLADAAATYQQVADESLPANASQEFRRAQQSARDELAALDPDVPHLVLTFHDPRDADRAQVSVDGKVLDSRRVSRPIALNPGEHHVEITAPDAQPVTVSRTLRVGQLERVEVAPLAKLEAAGPVEPATPPAADTGSTGLLAGGIVALGVGVAGLAMGTIAGVVALNKKSALEERCPDQWCQPDDQSLADAAKTNATLSTVGFVVGGVGAAAGIVLLAVRASSSPEPSQLAPEHQAAWRLELGPGSLAVRGRF
jgi:hypothetical protein